MKPASQADRIDLCRRFQRPLHRLRFAVDHQQIGAAGLIGLVVPIL